VVIGDREVRGRLAEAPGEARPQRRVLAGARIEIPALAAARRPDRLLQLALQLAVELRLDGRAHLDRVRALAVHRLQCAEDVFDLRLDHEHHRVMTEPGVRADDHEEVRIAGQRRAEIRVRAVAPCIDDIEAAAADDRAARERIGDLEAGAVDQAVHLMTRAVGRHDRVRFDARDAGRHDADIAARQRRVIVVRDQHALAAERVVGRDRAAQRRVRHLLADMAQCELLHVLHQPRMDREAEHARFEHPVEAAAHELLRERQRAEQPLFEPREAAVGLRHDPRRRALEQRERLHARRDLRHELDRARAGADHGDALAFERIRVIPLLRVERAAAEILDARNRRQRGARQAAHAGHQHARRQPLAVRERQTPALRALVVFGALQFVVHPQMRADPEALHAVFEIRADLGLRREHARPARVRRERERVDVRLHVAGAPGIVVVAPRAADRGRLLEHDEIRDARLPQANGHPEPGEAGADDGDVDGFVRAVMAGRAERQRASIHPGVSDWAHFLMLHWLM